MTKEINISYLLAIELLKNIPENSIFDRFLPADFLSSGLAKVQVEALRYVSRNCFSVIAAKRITFISNLNLENNDSIEFKCF